MSDDEAAREECWKRYDRSTALGVPIVSMKDELHKAFIAGWKDRDELPCRNYRLGNEKEPGRIVFNDRDYWR